ncbi:MAG: hypothetical protein LRZ85_05555 [Alphaproteobacteria bacterium]|nr:hypothetical protein [Alphaproteobacteria bacterium]MCD8520036.1 hypothetical protein [Alphaproteobacteria bacterium]MCD8569972.1 hypothetical protein [Alphaproteobacteria bacterium]
MDLTDKLYQAAAAVERGISRVVDGNPFAQINLIERTEKQGVWNIVEVDVEIPENYLGNDQAMTSYGEKWLNAALLQIESAHNAAERGFEVTLNKPLDMITIKTSLLAHEAEAIINSIQSFDTGKRRIGKDETIVRAFDYDL